MKLKRTSLSRKIQELAFGEWVDYRKNLCTHFWFTVLSCLWLTVFLPIKLLTHLFGMICDSLYSYENNRKFRYMAEGEKLTVQEVFVLLRKLGIVYGKYPKYYFNSCKVSRVYYSDSKDRYRARGWFEANSGNYTSLLDEYCRSIYKNCKPGDTKSVIFGTKVFLIPYIPIVCISTFVGMSLLAMLKLFEFFYISSYDGSIGQIVLCAAIAFGFGIIIILFILSGLYTVTKRFVERNSEPLKDDVFFSYLKAVKNKMCPLIEWQD